MARRRVAFAACTWLLPAALPAQHEPPAEMVVVDSESEMPLAGATLWTAEERLRPIGLDSWWQQVAVAGTDGALPTAALTEDSWWRVEATGHAPHVEMGLAYLDTITLDRGTSVPIELRDWMDRPRGGARVGLILGCGHTPPVRTVETDGHGRAVLEDVDPSAGDLWLSAPGLRSDEVSGWHGWHGWHSGDPPLVLHAWPGIDFSGVVVDEQGQPVAGVLVGSTLEKHGPWTVTDERGFFALTVRADLEPSVLRQGESEPLGIFPLPLVPGPVRLVVPNLDEDRAARLPVLVRAIDEAGQPLTDGFVRAVATEPDLTGDTDGVRGEPVTLRLRPGAYRIEVGGPFASHAGETVLDVRGPTSVELVAPANPSLQLSWPEREDGRVFVVTETAALDVTVAMMAGRAVHVPRRGKLWLRVQQGGESRLLPLPDDRAGWHAQPWNIDGRD